MQELTVNEIEEVNGAFLANLAMGVVGAAIGMGSYAIYGGFASIGNNNANNLNGAGFAAAAAGGFVKGAGGFNSVSATAGAIAAGSVYGALN